ncbi:MAG: hypothetical protein IT350_18720 [Deltaproteobacteria bacterium]|nr:hypothetical protein [Deltaproteobacteria bacterium]
MRRGSTFALMLICALLLPAASNAEEAGAPDLPNSSLSIPWSDFQKILERLTAGGTVEPPPPPHDALVTGADYVVRVVGDHAVAEVTVGIQVLKPRGWSSVPILSAYAPVLDAKLDGKPVALGSENDGRLHVVTDLPGAHVLTLRIEVPVEDTGGPRGFSLPTVTSPVNRLNVHLGAPDLDVRLVSGGHMRVENGSTETVAIGSFVQADPVRVEWSRRAPKAEREQARVTAETRTLVTVTEGLAVYTAVVDYQILHKPVSRFTIALPAGLNVADVTTNGLADWKAVEVDGGKELQIELAYEAAGHHRIAFTLEQSLPAEASANFTTADITVRDIVHEVGHLAVAVRGNVQVTAGKTANLAPLDVRELPPDLSAVADLTVLFGFKYVTHPATAELAIARHEDASVLACAVDQATYAVMLTNGGKELVEATLRVANRARQFIEVTLPPGADVWSVFRDGEPVKAAVKDGVLLLPVANAEGRETTTLRLTYFRQQRMIPYLWRRGLDLPAIDVPVQRVALTTYLPRGYRYFGFSGTLRPGGLAASTVPPDQNEDKRNLEGELDGLLRSEDKKGVKEKADELSIYRSQQTLVQKQGFDLPAAAENVAYSNAMTRGALPVAVQIAWDGMPMTFETRIVDPGEKPHLSFAYARYRSSALISFVLAILALVFGESVARRILRRFEPSLPEPGPLARRTALVAMAAPAVLGVFIGFGLEDFALAAFVGALFAVSRVLVIKGREAIANRPRREPPSPPPTPPVAPIANADEGSGS